MKVDFWKEYELFVSLFVSGSQTSIARIRKEDFILYDDITGAKLTQCKKCTNIDEAKEKAVCVLEERYRKIYSGIDDILKGE